MTDASSIASHGRVGKVSAVSVGSFGRIYKAVISIVVRGLTEVMHLTSKVSRILRITSEVG